MAACRLLAAFAERDFLFLVPIEPKESLLGLIPRGGSRGLAFVRFECPLWVKSRHRRKFSQCPLYPQKRTSELRRGMSALCQKRTFCTAGGN